MPFGTGMAADPTLTPAVYDPEAPLGSRWSSDGMSASTIPRLYHSTALLLPGKSVFWPRLPNTHMAQTEASSSLAPIRVLTTRRRRITLPNTAPKSSTPRTGASSVRQSPVYPRRSPTVVLLSISPSALRRIAVTRTRLLIARPSSSSAPASLRMP